MDTPSPRTPHRGLSPLPLIFLSWAALAPAEAVSQLVPATATALGTGGNYAALARGFASVGINPANLGLDDNPGWSLGVPLIGAMQGLEPVTLGDLLSYDADFFPDEKKEDWLAQIQRAGRQTGRGRVEVTGFAASVGPLAFQMHSQLAVDASLNPFAAELLLFGDLGRTGGPIEVGFAGSEADGAALTTFALGGGVPVARDLFGFEDEVLAVGANITVSVGNGLFLARDAGTSIGIDPPSVMLALPVLQTQDDPYRFDGGTGVGLDLGIGWQGGPWGLSASLANVFHTFEWDRDRLVYVPGAVVADAGGVTVDTDERPAEEAPPFLLRELDRFRIRPRMTLGGSWRVRDGATLVADVAHRFGDGLPLGPATRAGMGVDLQVIRQIAFQAGATWITDGFQAGVGSSLTFGPFNLGGAFQWQRGDVGNAELAAISVTFNTR